MLCPECHASYREGFTHCPDCDVDLVDTLPGPGSDADPLGGDLATVYTTEEEDICVSVCKDLRKAGIPFKVLQHEQQFLKGVDTHFAIEVPPGFREQAQKLIEQGASDFSDTEEEQRIMQLPAEDDSESDESTGPDSGAHCHKEDATAEVWSGNSQETTEMIELALRENDILARVTEGDDGSRRLFVRPQDEHRAREIVREITEADPK
jgi:hypothetical protein